MSTIQEVNAEELAKLFFNYREALSHGCSAHGCTGHDQPETLSWERTPHSERKLIVAAARLALLELSTPHVGTTPGRKYYAKPGEADWGC
jgi:hypothetical protein